MFCALYCEAEALIAHFQLHKDPGSVCFQVFGDEEAGIRIALTGAGPIAAATAVGSICTRYGIGKDDMLLNVGTCAASAEGMDGIYVCSKLVEHATGRTFYPDMLYRHPFAEGTLVTGDTVWRGTQPEGESRQFLYDMEGAAVYQAGNHFVGPHRMQFVKLVSDCGDAQPSQKQISALMNESKEALSAYIEELQQILRQEKKGRAMLSEAGQMQLDALSRDFHCSRTMKDELRQQLLYQELSGGNYEAFVREMYEDGRLPCRDRKEGKKRFEEFKQKLL